MISMLKVALTLGLLTLVHVIVAVPTPTMETRPLAETVATLGLLVVHVTALFQALDGITVGISCNGFMFALVRCSSVRFRVISVTAWRMVTVQRAQTLGWVTLRQVIVATPSPLSVT